MINAANQSLDEEAPNADPVLKSDCTAGDCATIANPIRWEHASGDGFTYRLPTPSDAQSLAKLWAEMQRHYGQAVSDVTVKAAAAFACRAHPTTGFDPRVLVAVAETGIVVGALALNVTFPAERLTRSLYIRDLYVALAARRGGVARGLLRTAASLTLSEGFSSLDWTAGAKNAGARQLYESAGALQIPRVYFRLEGAALLRATGT